MHKLLLRNHNEVHPLILLPLASFANNYQLFLEDWLVYLFVVISVIVI